MVRRRFFQNLFGGGNNNNNNQGNSGNIQGPVQPGTTLLPSGETVPTSSLFQGPVQPGTNEETFRRTGRSTPSFQGPIEPGTDPNTFRQTGEGITPEEAQSRRIAQERQDTIIQSRGSGRQRLLTLQQQRELGLRSRPKTQPNLFLERRLEREAREKRQEREFQSFEKSPREIAIDRAIEERTGMRPGTPESLLGDEGSDAVFGHNANVPALEMDSIDKPINQSVLSEARPNTGDGRLDNLGFSISQSMAELRTKANRGELKAGGRFKLFGLSLAGSLTNQAIGIRELVKNPKLIKEIPRSTIKEFKSIGGDLKSKTPEVGLGKIGGLYLGAKVIDVAVTKAPVKISDTIRTTGLKEIPQQKVIAPEFFAGQRFPQVKKGSTAGDLLKEFKGDFSGFTASPKPFSSTTKAGKGSSELSGVYQAPKISPNFLRVTQGEKKVFSFNPFQTLRPTVTKINPTSFELAKGVKPGQTAPAGRVGFKVLKVPVIPTKIAEIKQFFKFQKAPTVRFGKDPQGKRLVAQFSDPSQQGKSIVAFMKTEKEAIIPAGTDLFKTGRSGFFKFEGRRIPIEEFSTKKGGVVKTDKVFSTKDVSISSSRKVGSRSISSPLDIFKGSKSIGGSSSSSRGSSISSFTSTPKSSSPLFSNKPSQSSPIIKPRTSTSLIPSFYRGSSSFRSSPFFRGSSSSRGVSSSRGFTPSTKQDNQLSKVFKPKTNKKQRNLFPVLVRRRGEFKIKGYGRTRGEAEAIGKNIVGKTLARSFLVPGSKNTLIPGFKTKKSPLGNIFIEPSRRALGTRSETNEIQFFKRRKKRGSLF